ncbi:MAG: hypothetical protein CME64_16850 [Halobacteriovoraceae bacterium]|nr:hypothetical protein [Halobacteriovoraceae bacterium]|tara:strand:+ start:192463 stop:193332 length:870 start_codon:yes stop_codon:yes gene_type:complete
MNSESETNLFGEAKVHRLLETTKLNILIYVCFVFVITTGIAFGFRVTVYAKYDWSTWVTGLVVVLALAQGFYLIKTKNLRYGAIGLHILMFILMPIRVFQTGGPASPIILGYLLHCVIAFSVNGRKFGAWVLAWSVFNIIAMTVLSYNFQMESSPFLESPLGAGVADLLMLFLILLPIIFILGEKDLLAERTVYYEKRETSYLIMRRLTHEYGNYLNIALGYVELIKMDPSRELIDRIQSSLKEMDKILKELVKISDEGDLAAFLKKAESEVKILKAFKEEQEQNNQIH